MSAAAPVEYESDADRLAMLVALGGVRVSAPGGSFHGVLEVDYEAVGEVGVESTSPRLTVRSSDMERCRVYLGAALHIGQDVYQVRSVQPDGTGMTVLVLEGP